MSYATIIIPLILAFIAYKVLAGVLKVGAIIAIIGAAFLLYSQGYFA